MNNNNKQLIKYKERIFSIIKKIFSIFFKKENKDTTKITDSSDNEWSKENQFLKDISRDEIKEKERILNLKVLYDNGQLDPYEISDEDIQKIIYLYEYETKNLNCDTEKRLKKIEKILKENKNV